MEDGDPRLSILDLANARLHDQGSASRIELTVRYLNQSLPHSIDTVCNFAHNLQFSIYAPKARLLTTTGTKPSPSTNSPTSIKSNSDKLISSTQGRFHFDESMPPTTRPTFCSKTRAAGLSATGRLIMASSIPLANSCTTP